jgi:L-ascorbate metabolism protein UlaG (beta-lactamase superfamily)
MVPVDPTTQPRKLRRISPWHRRVIGRDRPLAALRLWGSDAAATGAPSAQGPTGPELHRIPPDRPSPPWTFPRAGFGPPGADTGKPRAAARSIEKRDVIASREPASEGPRTTVTYLGHATLLIETGGETIATDPIFADRVGRFFTKRAVPLSIRPEELPRVAGVLISHAHHDHLDYRSLKRVGRDRPLIVPWGLAAPMRWRGHSDVRVARLWKEFPLGPWRVTAVPSRHFGGRLPLVYTSGHVGYVLSGPRCIYFAGDTGLDEPMFREIGRRFDIDLAILPIAGAVFPWFRRNHMNAEDALRAFQALGATQMLPMHYGTFPASFEPAHEPRRRLLELSSRLGLGERVVILPPGGHVELPGTRAGGPAADPRGSPAGPIGSV